MSGLDFLFGKGGLAAVAGTAWVDPAAGLARGLKLDDQTRKMGGNQAFELPSGRRGWLVLNGSVDLFLLSRAGVAEGGDAVRRHVLRVPAGGLALTLAQDGAAFVAVPSNGAELVELEWGRLISAAADADLAGPVAAALEPWLDALAAVAAAGPMPSDTTLVDADAALDLKAGQPIAARRGVHWLPTAAVAARLPGGAEVDDSAAHLPMLPGLWLQAEADATVTPLSLANWLATPQAEADLAAFQGYAVGRIVARLGAAAAEEGAQAELARRHRSNNLSQALLGLGTVMARGGVPLGDLPKQPVAAAATLVWHHLGIAQPIGPAVEARLDADGDPVGALSRETGLFMRAIRLEGAWWRADHGALLAFHGPDQRPCALLPAGVARYHLIDPQSGEARPVDAALGASVEPKAFTFYEPFAHGPVQPRGLMRFGFRQSGRDLAMVVAMALATGLLSLALPVITGWVMDPVIPEAEMSQLAVLISALVIAGLSATGLGLVQSLAMLRFEGRMSNRVESAVWDRLLRLPASFFRAFSVGDLANRAQGIDHARALMTGTVTASLLHAVSGLFSFGFMVYVSWRLAMVTLLVAAVYAAVVLVIGRLILKRNRETLALTGQLQGIVLQLLGAVGKLRVAGAESGAFARWAQPYSQLLRISYEQQRLNNLLLVFRGGFHFLAVAGLVFVVALQGHELWALFATPTTWPQINADALHKVMPTGNFVSFHVAFGQFFATVFGLTQTLVKLSNITPLYERIQPILKAEVESEAGAEDPGQLSGGIEIRDVCFRYAEGAPLILDGLSLQVEPGQFVAIVGPSGAGKSTLVRLLLGFDLPESGSIFYDGHDIKQLDKRLLRRQLGVVLQNGWLLSGSMFHNITAGANLTRDDAMWAARLAGLDKDIERMPMGLDTFLGEGAATLSGGQRQRLMIARAVVRRPRILIFDEATSALDNETQAIVSRGLEALSATRFVIAHRLSTVVQADRIFVITGGRIVEEGRFDELMAKDGVFADLAKRQMV